MKKIWQPRARMAVIAAASFVLLVTVLPQIGSSIGLTSLANRIVGSESCVGSGSSGSSGSSSMCCSGSSSSSGVGGQSSISGQCGMGTVTGTVTVTGAPKKFIPAYLGAGACPTVSPPNEVCSDPQYALATNGVYTLSLSPGTWRVSGFYENGPYGGAFLGCRPDRDRDVRSNGAPESDRSVQEACVLARDHHHQERAAVRPGRASRSLALPVLRALQRRHAVDRLRHRVRLAAWRWRHHHDDHRWQHRRETAADEQHRHGVLLVDRPASGDLDGVPGLLRAIGLRLQRQEGCGRRADPRWQQHGNVSTNFLLPGEALLTGTVSVTGAPSGFSDEVGVTACPAGGQSGGASYCHTFYGFSGNRYTMVLDAGQWSVKGFYLAEPYDNAVDGPTQLVTLAKKQTTNLYLERPVPGPWHGHRQHHGERPSRRRQGRVLHRPGLPLVGAMARRDSRTRMRERVLGSGWVRLRRGRPR